MEPLRLDYFTDLLCVWAYVSQVRLDELKKSFGDRIQVHHHFVPIFGDVHHRIETKWKDRGGLDGFADHLQAVGREFPHVEMNPDLCRTFVPASSVPAHLFLKAVELGCADIQGAFEKTIDGVRQAWFRENRTVHRMPSLMELAKGVGLPFEAIHEKVHSGEAMAAMSRDIDLAREMDVKGSPTWILNDGRQKLYGNVGYRILEANVQELLERPEGGASWC